MMLKLTDLLTDATCRGGHGKSNVGARSMGLILLNVVVHTSSKVTRLLRLEND